MQACPLYNPVFWQNKNNNTVFTVSTRASLIQTPPMPSRHTSLGFYALLSSALLCHVFLWLFSLLSASDASFSCIFAAKA